VINLSHHPEAVAGYILAVIPHLEHRELCATGTIPNFTLLKLIFPSTSVSFNVFCPLGYKQAGSI
jgi:hypothetical protein